jgi:hypothetical protein
MDLLDEIKGKLLVEIEGIISFVNLEFKNLPKFCINCQTVGHSTAHCRKNPQVTKNEKLYANMVAQVTGKPLDMLSNTKK